MKYKLLLIAVFFISIFFISCEEEDDQVYSPRPRGYCRIDFPEKNYRIYDSICPYEFEIPTYAHIEQDRHSGADPCWLNLEFPKFNATIHLSYKDVNNDLAQHLENSHYFANKHQVKATGLDEVVILKDSTKVYGLLFDIGGNTASTLQFYLTDSAKHFLRGALYFNSVPNIDSLKIVVDFIREDVLHMINTTHWKNN
ncbi:gliding motility lipoprotein GldD [Aurantibacillus circumpalustris]|uniref:gliding motility lipoprotein GldD n=1 Tax=Aurantibacillus circumpalustris TaxID=3036359 RepID=UPI00295AC61C|nr:gliding motility lipoprotein GldD [Aurantibacillus circumpalustris]